MEFKNRLHVKYHCGATASLKIQHIIVNQGQENK